MPARLVPLAVGTTAGAVSGLAESGLVHRLTRGRLWIGVLTTLLVGIVGLNVIALSFNATSSKVTRQIDSLERQNSTLRTQIAASGASSDRVQALASQLGMTVPEPGAVGYLHASPKDAEIAAKRLESGELAAGAPAAAASAVTTDTTTTTDPTAVTTTPTTTTPTVTETTPTATTPTVTTTPVPTIDPASGTGAVSTP
jgi:cell division septation protein DedD